MLHAYDEAIGKERITLPPLQNVVGPDGVTVADGKLFTMMRAVSVTLTLPQPGCDATTVITFVPVTIDVVFTGIFSADPVPATGAETALLL